MTGDGAIRALVVDDHDLFRRGLRESLEEHGIRVVGEAANGEDAVALAGRAQPDVVVMDLGLPRMSGIEATRRLLVGWPQMRVLVLTLSVEAEDVMDAMMAGACGYLMKDATVEEIVSAVRAAAAGQSSLSPTAAGHLLERLRGRAGPDDGAERVDLSERELEILRLVAEGCDNEDIAARLVLSPRTVKNHVSSILGKLGLDNRVQAAVYAVRKGIV